MTANDVNRAIAQAGQRAGAAVAAALAAREQDEQRIREIVREELAAHAAKLGHDGVQAVVGDARSTLKPLNPVLQSDGVDGQNRHPFGDDAVELIKALLDIVLTDGAQGQEALERCLARRHGVGNLVEHGAEHLPGLVGGHQTSPSHNGLDSLSVGDGPATGGDPAGPGHPKGGAQ